MIRCSLSLSLSLSLSFFLFIVLCEHVSFRLVFSQLIPFQSQAVRYLEACVKVFGNTDPAVHNYLLSLYVKDQSEDNLLTYIISQNEAPIFDVNYALRLCLANNKTASCVHLYALLGQFEMAVELALTVRCRRCATCSAIADKRALLCRITLSSRNKWQTVPSKTASCERDCG
jgi:hypothetical protein